MTGDWPQIKARLEFFSTDEALKGHFYIDDEQSASALAADIRVALQRVEELEAGENECCDCHDAAREEIGRLCQRVEELEREKERITSDWARWEVECSNRLKAAEAKLARVLEAIINEECYPPAAATTVQEQGFWSAGVATLRSKLLAAAKG